jgi:hypothetical protein
MWLTLDLIGLNWYYNQLAVDSERSRVDWKTYINLESLEVINRYTAGYQWYLFSVFMPDDFKKQLELLGT